MPVKYFVGKITRGKKKDERLMANQSKALYVSPGQKKTNKHTVNLQKTSAHLDFHYSGPLWSGWLWVL